ncbi:MAG: NYN domain-containing protein [Anaerolineae bacterium]
MTRYLIDGYNLFFRIAQAKPTLQKKRRDLIESLSKVIEAFRLDAVIIFDGRQEREDPGRRMHLGALEIIYTACDQTADEYIIEELTYSKKVENQLVITSDLTLKAKAKALGAKTESIETFLSRLSKKKKKKIELSSSSHKRFEESPLQIERLLKIFEERLKNEGRSDPDV